MQACWSPPLDLYVHSTMLATSLKPMRLEITAGRRCFGSRGSFDERLRDLWARVSVHERRHNGLQVLYGV